MVRSLSLSRVRGPEGDAPSRSALEAQGPRWAGGCRGEQGSAGRWDVGVLGTLASLPHPQEGKTDVPLDALGVGSGGGGRFGIDLMPLLVRSKGHVVRTRELHLGDEKPSQAPGAKGMNLSTLVKILKGFSVISSSEQSSPEVFGLLWCPGSPWQTPRYHHGGATGSHCASLREARGHVVPQQLPCWGWRGSGKDLASSRESRKGLRRGGWGATGEGRTQPSRTGRRGKKPLKVFSVFTYPSPSSSCLFLLEVQCDVFSEFSELYNHHPHTILEGFITPQKPCIHQHSLPLLPYLHRPQQAADLDIFCKQSQALRGPSFSMTSPRAIPIIPV